MNILIKNIVQKIDKKLKKLEFKPLVSPQKFVQKFGTKKHRYWSICQTKNGKKIAFYARLHDNKDAQEKFLNEIKFFNKIFKGDRLSFDKKREKFFKSLMPRFLTAGLEEDFEWLVREYFIGQPLGHSRMLKIEISEKMASRLAKIIFQINQTPIRYFKNLRLKKFDWQNYINVKNSYFGLTKNGIIKKETHQKINKFLKNKTDLLKRENHYFCHGDLNLGNIIFYRNSFKIIDWELMHLNNFVYDFAYCWTHLWQASKGFRQKLVQAYLKLIPASKIKIFKTLLPITVIYFTLGGIIYRSRQLSKQYLLARRNFYLKIVSKAVEGYEELIKT